MHRISRQGYRLDFKKRQSCVADNQTCARHLANGLPLFSMREIPTLVPSINCLAADFIDCERRKHHARNMSRAVLVASHLGLSLTVVALCWSYQPARAKPSPLELPMAKKLQLVRFNEVDPNHVGTISLREIEARVRKALPPPSQLHQSKVKYRRRPKHRGQPVD